MQLNKQRKDLIRYAIAALIGAGLGFWVLSVLASSEIYMYPERFGMPQRPLPFDSPERDLFNAACNYYFLILCLERPYIIMISTFLVLGLFHLNNKKRGERKRKVRPPKGVPSSDKNS